MTITINGTPAEPGCYIGGHRGQYGVDDLFDLAVGYGFTPRSLHDNMHLLRKVAERADERFWSAYYDPAVRMKRQVLRLLASSSPVWKLTPTPNRDGDPEYHDFPIHSWWEARTWLADDLEEWLNDHTERGTWGWDDGEFFLEYADDPDDTFIWVCSDCAHIDANGEVAPDVDADVLWSKLDQEHWHYLPADDPERRFGDIGYEDFSSRSCEACGTHLAGARYRYVMWPNQAAQEAYLTDMLHAYEAEAMSLATHTEYVCPECDEPVEWKPSGWYFHVGLQGECSLRAMDVPGERITHMEDVDAELAPEALDEMRGDCEAFMKDEWAYVCDLDPAQVGIDFWLTRNHHGTGFWDRGHPDWLGRHLSEASYAYGDADLYLGDDGQVHHS